jgi:hypothetical protein
VSTVLFLSLLFLSMPGTRPHGEPPDLQARLDTKVAQYSLSANGLADALLRTSGHFKIPMGIEWVRDKETSQNLSRSWNDQTPREILQSILKQYPGYVFRIEEGVIHVFREDLIKDSRNFLCLKIPDSFDARQKPAGLINTQLRAVVQGIVSPRDFPPTSGEGGSYATGIREQPLSLTLQGLTVREGLEKLAAASEHQVWIVTFADTVDLTPTGFLRTETLWHAKAFPNSQQPMWDFLLWSEPIPQTSAP